jgi:glucose-1-phosphate thymidylyltransferase
MKLIIPLAGKGTRLRPHTITKPKPLLKVAGKPILKHLLDSLSDLKFSEVIFITGHLKEKVEEYVKKNYSFKSLFIEQKTMDGTAGAIRLAKRYINEDVMILYADTIFDADMGIVKKMKSEKNVGGIIWVKEVEDYQRFGVVVTDNHGFMTKIVEKPKDPISRLANVGLYYIKDYKLMFEGIEYVYKNKITLGGEYFLTDAFEYMIKHGSRIKTIQMKGWYDCGKVETLLETNRILLDKLNKHISKSAKIKDSILKFPVFIGDNVVMENCIVGPHVSIAEDSVLSSSIICNSLIDVGVSVSDVKIKDSVIGEGASVKGVFKRLNVGDYSELHIN